MFPLRTMTVGFRARSRTHARNASCSSHTFWSKPSFTCQPSERASRGPTMKDTYLSRCLWCVRCLRQGIPWRQDPQNSHFRVARTREVLGNSTVVAVASGCRTQSKIYAAVCVCVRMCRYGVCVYIHPVYTYTSVCVCVCVCMHLCVCCVYTKHGEWRHGLHQQ